MNDIYEIDSRGLRWNYADNVEPPVVGVEYLVELEDYERVWAVWDGHDFIRKAGGLLGLKEDTKVKAYIWADTEE